MMSSEKVSPNILRNERRVEEAVEVERSSMSNEKNNLSQETECDRNMEGNTLLETEQRPVNCQQVEEDDDRDECKDDEDENSVIPVWPSRGDHNAQMARRRLSSGKKSEIVQHKVYSLRDYSQVAAPSASVSSENAQYQQIASNSSHIHIQSAPSHSTKLVKSLSQERKAANLKGKRMSECFYPPHPIVAFTPPALLEEHARGRSQQVDGSDRLSGSVHPPTGESRIERVRKLFVAPLSLSRSSASSSSLGFKRTPPVGAGPTGVVESGQSTGASASPRLSLQSGASGTLNKPHQQLLQAVYAAQRGSSNRRPTATGRASKNSPKGTTAKGSFQVYGCPLQLANNIYPITCFGRPDVYKQQSVPYVLARLCIYIEENSSHLTHEGIFRVSGNARLMDKLKTLFDHLGDAPLESESVDVATSASMLKMYLRELPEPLIPTRLNYYFITLAKKYSILLASASATNLTNCSNSIKNLQRDTAAAVNSTQSASGGDSSKAQLNERQKLSFSRDLMKLLRKLPIENYNLLKYLACFLYRVSLKQQYNKMCAEALGIVFGPNVFRIRSESYKGLKEQELSNQIMASIISNYKSIFDSELTDPLGNLIDDVCANDKVEANVTQLLPEPISPIGGERGSADSSVCNIISVTSETAQNAAENVEERGTLSNIITTQNDFKLLAGNNESADNFRIIASNDEDCEEDESFTPSSGSGSYCSLVDSESLESSYAERDIDDEYNEVEDDKEDDENLTTDMDEEDENSTDELTSSNCPSDTSYTPTSSHSPGESDIDVQSSLKLNGLLNESGHSSCLECARRESATAPSLLGRRLEKSVEYELEPTLETKNYNNIFINKRNSTHINVTNCDNINSNAAPNPSGKALRTVLRQRHQSQGLNPGQAIDSSEMEGQQKKQRASECLRRRSWSASLASSTNRASRLRRVQLTTLRRLQHTTDTRRSNRIRRLKNNRSKQLVHGYSRQLERDQQVAPRRSLRPGQLRVVSEPSRCSSSSDRSFLAGDEVSNLKLDSLIPHLLKMSPEDRKIETGFNISSKRFLMRSFNSDYTLLRSSNFTIPSISARSINVIRRHLSELKLWPENIASSTQNSGMISRRSSAFASESNNPLDFEDSILIQMEATRTLARSLKRLRRLGESFGYTKEMELIVQELVEASCSESSHWLACYVDHLSAIKLAEQIEKQLLEVRSAARVENARLSKPTSSEFPVPNLPPNDAQQAFLSNQLALRISLLMQRYWDLKNIRDHNMKNHNPRLLLSHHSWLRQVQKSFPKASPQKSFSADSLTARLTGVQGNEHKLSEEPSIAEDDDLRKLDESGVDLDKAMSSCWFGALCPVEFVCGMERRLWNRRKLAHRQVSLHEMNPEQLASEKLELQKNLLRYEHWFGRPARKLEASLVGHIYERYRTVKLLRQVIKD